LNFTYTKNISKIVELHENVANFINLSGNSDYGNYRVSSVAKVGESYGLLMSDSTPMLDEVSGLPILHHQSFYSSMRAMYYLRDGTPKIVGSLVPDFLGSINTVLTYRNISLRASFDMRFGGYVACYTNRYGTAYGLTKTSLAYRDSENGGMTYTSIWDQQTYHDGFIPVGIIPGGEVISIPGGTYTIKPGGETYEELYNAGYVDPQHGSTWHWWQNSWGNGVINDSWFTKLNYIALREVTLSYRMPSNIAAKIGARDLAFSLSGRNLGYLLNSMPNNVNPESVRGTSATEFRIRSFNGYTANYAFTINVGF
jgi:iron complex outermembrane receptor protein